MSIGADFGSIGQQPTFDDVQRAAHEGQGGKPGVNDGNDQSMSKDEFVTGAEALGIDKQQAQDMWQQANVGLDGMSAAEYESSESGPAINIAAMAQVFAQGISMFSQGNTDGVPTDAGVGSGVNASPQAVQPGAPPPVGDSGQASDVGDQDSGRSTQNSADEASTV